MKYTLPDGSPCNAAVWAAAFRDPANRYLAQDTAGELLINTSWVGIEMPSDKTPALFVTSVSREGKPPEPVADYWTGSWQEALDRHHSLVAELAAGQSPPRKRGKQ